MGEMARGDRLDEKNPFRWNKLIFNIPGSKGYNPEKSWCFKVWRDKKGNMLANDFEAYVDDVRVVGSSKEGCRRTLRKVMSTLQALGIQDAAQKRRNSNKGVNPWAGAIIHSSKGTSLFQCQIPSGQGEREL